MRITNDRPVLPSQFGGLLIEFALILPVFLLLVFGTVEACLIMYNKSVITNAARVGARSGILLRVPALSVVDTENLAETNATTHASAGLISLGSSAVATANAVVTTTAGAATVNPNDKVTVTVSYTYQGLFLISLLGFTSNRITLESSATMFHE